MCIYTFRCRHIGGIVIEIVCDYNLVYVMIRFARYKGYGIVALFKSR